MDKTLEAFARLADEYGDATLTIVGIGEMEQALRARIAELHLEGRVTLTGGLPHEEVLRRMAQSDLFVLPSWGEGYGIVYIEAMAAGCIAVGAENEGIADTITDGGTRTRWSASCAPCSPIPRHTRRCARGACATRAS